MSKELELYQAFIDGLVERKDSMTALWVKGDGFPKTEDNKAKNELLAALTPEQKGVLAELLQDEHIAGASICKDVDGAEDQPLIFGIHFIEDDRRFSLRCVLPKEFDVLHLNTAPSQHGGLPR